MRPDLPSGGLADGVREQAAIFRGVGMVTHVAVRVEKIQFHKGGQRTKCRTPGSPVSKRRGTRRVRPASFLHTVPMGDQQFPRTTEPDNPGALSRARQWSRDHRGKLLVAGAAITAAAVALRVRGGNGSGPLVLTAVTAAKEAAESAAAASTRVADEFDALGRDYRMAAMDQTVGQAFRRHQRWTEEEMSVLRDGTKTALDKALELHRTFNGVSSKSIREGLSSLAP